MRRFAGISLLVLAACSKPLTQEWSFASEGGSQCAPALVGETLVFGNESGYVHAVDRRGNSRWSFAAHRDVIGTPVGFEGLVLFGSVDNLFYAVNAANGREAWKFATRDRIKGDPVLHDGKVVFGSYDKHLYALDAKTGKLAWRFPPLPPKPDTLKAQAATPSVPAKGDDQAAIPQPAAAKPEPEVVPGEFSYAAPLVIDGVLYVGNLDGYLYAIDASSGELRWRFQTGGGITSGAAHHAGVLYFGSNDHNVYALDLATRQPKWKLQTGDEVNASPRLADGTLYVGGVDGIFRAVDMASGQLRWQFETRGRIVAAADLHEKLVFVGAGPGDGTLYALDSTTGKAAWTFPTGSKIEADLVVDGDRLLLVVGDGRLISFAIRKDS